MLVALQMFCDGQGNNMDGEKCMYMQKDSCRNTHMPPVIGVKDRRNTHHTQRKVIMVGPTVKNNVEKLDVAHYHKIIIITTVSPCGS